MIRQIVEARLWQALRVLLANDKTLIEYDAHEVTICGRLAMYLQCVFPAYDVDIEYNLEGSHTKRLGGDPVRPDIIVHRRGNDKSNLLAVELKKTPVSEESRYRDRLKLKGYSEEYRYCFAVWITLPVGNKRDITPEINWVAASAS